MGDLSKSEYESRRTELRTALARLEEPEAHGRPEMLDRLQRYVLNADAAWDDADDAQRNRLVRALFESVLVQDQHLVAVRPRPEFQPYLTLAQTEEPTSLRGMPALKPRMWRRARGDSNPRSRP